MDSQSQCSAVEYPFHSIPLVIDVDVPKSQNQHEQTDNKVNEKQS